ncbi:ATP-dependent RNA helicase [Spraguea lophii 42_110]|uniref:ATP-dependent RNA helicase n=1 Tax=Spraguea lophii (strain 42_110) TaxID=1358809 RepID=S7XL94_SPRLO|nr:ATP-dependent RNA helicase [Spraguea lophii 42_110]
MDKNEIFSYVDEYPEKELIKKKKPKHTTFRSLGLSKKLLNNIRFKFLTGIQRKTILKIIEGMDLSIVSSTGTGKSYAYVIAVVELALKNKKSMIVLPTKELALHIISYINSLTKNTNIKADLFIGEGKIDKDLKSMKECNIIVGTVGRITNILPEDNEFKFDTLILDEADAFVEERLTELYKRIKFNQKIILSATQTKFETDTTIVKDEIKINENVTNYFFYLPSHQKLNAIFTLLKKHKRILIFVNSAKNVELLETKLKDRFDSICGIYSDMENRKEIFRDFIWGRINILIATDLVSRGVDINADCIINFDLCDPVSFLHRIGRIGRDGSLGVQYSLVGSEDIGYFQEIKDRFFTDIEFGRIPDEELHNGLEMWDGHTNKNTKGKGAFNLLGMEKHSFFKGKWTLKDEIRKVKYATKNVEVKKIENHKKDYRDQFYIPYKKN